MPCYNPPTPLEEAGKKMPAVLCGLVRALGPEKVVEVVDWAQAGVTEEEFLEWWQLHKAEDELEDFLRNIQKIQVSNPRLHHIDPRSTSLSADKRLLILEECKTNFEYFMFVVGLGSPSGVTEWVKQALRKQGFPQDSSKVPPPAAPRANEGKKQPVLSLRKMTPVYRECSKDKFAEGIEPVEIEVLGPEGVQKILTAPLKFGIAISLIGISKLSIEDLNEQHQVAIDSKIAIENVYFKIPTIGVVKLPLGNRAKASERLSGAYQTRYIDETFRSVVPGHPNAWIRYRLVGKFSLELGITEVKGEWIDDGGLAKMSEIIPLGYDLCAHQGNSKSKLNHSQ